MKQCVRFILGRSEYTAIYRDDPEAASLEILRVSFPRPVGTGEFPEEPLVRATGTAALRLIAWLERDLLRCTLAELARPAVA